MNETIQFLVEIYIDRPENPDWNQLLTALKLLGYNNSEAQEICYAIRQGEY